MPLVTREPQLYAPLMGDGAMHKWLAQAARKRREDAEVAQAEIGALLVLAGYKGSETKISRFERGDKWMDDTEAIIGAYAACLEISSFEIWADALALAAADDEIPEPAAIVEHAAQQLRRSSEVPETDRTELGEDEREQASG